MAVYLLNKELWFPDPHCQEDDNALATDEEKDPYGLIAIGGDLSVERLLLAYSRGIFPWYAFEYNSIPHWYCPLDRFVIFPKEIHISHSMKQLMRQNRYIVTSNQDFEGVIRGCSQVDGRILEDGAWLGPDIIRAYTALHRQGYAVSVEVWEAQDTIGGKKARRLVGGLYGVAIRNAFFGESMFSIVPNASKLALIHLAKAMESSGGLFIDCQFETPHLKSMGGRHISYDEYMEMLNKQSN